MPSPELAPDTRPVQVLRDNAVAILQFNRPDALNALDVTTARTFRAACVELAADASVRAVIVRGVGRAFGVGGDLSAMRGDAAAVAAQLIEPLHASVKLLAALDAPVIASLHGVVAGGSLSLALPASWRSPPRARASTSPVRASARAAMSRARGICRGGWGCARRCRSPCGATASIWPRRCVWVW